VAISLGKSPSLGSKPSTGSAGRDGLSVGVSQSVGTVGGVGLSVEASVKVPISAQGVSVKKDNELGTTTVTGNIGSASSKLGINLGIETSSDENGNVTVTGGSAAVSVLGFGIEGSTGKGGSSLGLGMGIVKVAIGIDSEGQRSLKLCVGSGFAEVCISASPDGKKTIASSTPAGNGVNDPVVLPSGSDRFCRIALSCEGYSCSTFPANSYYEFREVKNEVLGKSNSFSTLYPSWSYRQTQRYQAIDKQSGNVVPGSTTESSAIVDINGQYSTNRTINGRSISTNGALISGRESDIYDYIQSQMNRTYIRDWWLPNAPTPQQAGYTIHLLGWWSHTYKAVSRYSPADGLCYVGGNTEPPNQAPSVSIQIRPIGLPNYPQTYKKMDCCELTKDIHRYLGIARLKKRKFKVANAMMVPSGTGNSQAEDYYEITEMLIKMLANGLIVNPKTKPLGSDFQHANATAWASQMYEMQSESMSDGNSSQKYEVSAIMQMTQIMSAVAELSRKVDFLQEAIGILPVPKSEELPVCFTIYEGHKGFGKKEPKKIDITKAKTDNQVEKVLATMLQPSLIPIVRWEFSPGSISIAEAINRG
jgi:hypothetical protein